MNLRHFLGVCAGAAAVALLIQCGSGSSAPTITPTPKPPIQVSPIPTPTPSPTPTPAPTLPTGMVCSPTPPPLLRMQLKIHANDAGRLVLDSKPVVPNIDHYCARVGFGEWKFCDTRPEGDLQRVACDYMATGMSEDTGRWGPTWYYGNDLCGSGGGCSNHPTNQFMAIAKVSGTYTACAADSAPVADNGGHCGEIDVTVTP